MAGITTSKKLHALPSKAALLLSEKNTYLGMLSTYVKEHSQGELQHHMTELHHKLSLAVPTFGDAAEGWVEDALGDSKPGNKQWCTRYGVGTSVQTLRNWAKFNGHLDAREQTLDTIVLYINSNRSLISDIGRVVQEFKVEDFYDEVDLYTFAEKFMLSADDVQHAVDEFQWGNLLPGFGYYLNDSDASKYREYFGIYAVFHRAPVDPEIILQSTLRIRYEVNVSKDVNLIRCKLHLPCVTDSVHPSASFFSYDGRVTHRGPGFQFWNFEENKQGAPGKPDFVDMVTRDLTDGVATGVLSSVWSSESKQPYSSAVVIVRQNFGEVGKEADFAKSFMRNSHQLHSGLNDMKQALTQQVSASKLTMSNAQFATLTRELEPPRVLLV